METDSPIFQSINATEPPPLFRVLGVMDWAYKFENPVEMKKEIIRAKRPKGTELIIQLKIIMFLNAGLTFKNIIDQPYLQYIATKNCMNFRDSSAFNTKSDLKS
jgi:hypothetical protein